MTDTDAGNGDVKEMVKCAVRDAGMLLLQVRLLIPVQFQVIGTDTVTGSVNSAVTGAGSVNIICIF